MKYLIMILSIFFIVTTATAEPAEIWEVTAYCACTICCGDNADGFTASGVRPVEGVTAATNDLPYGTHVVIDEVGERVIEDRMAKKYSGGNYIDIYFDNHEDAVAFGRKRLVTVRC